MKIKIIKIGSDKNDALVIAAGEYLRRISKPWVVEVVALKEIKKPAANTATIMALEGKALLKAAEGCGLLIALDAAGKQTDSEGFANHLQHCERAYKSIAFIIGGSAGLSADVLKACNEKLSLSKMTLPHRLAFLTLVEQIYRATQIISGGPYHK